MSMPYYKRFPRDFLEGTIGLPFEVKCAYAVVLDLIYMRDGRLPDDARYIAGQLGCSVRKWSSILEVLIVAGKLRRVNGFIANFRADYLVEETRKYRDKQAENRRGCNENNDIPERSSNHTDTEAESEPEEDTAVVSASASNVVVLPVPGSDWPEGDARRHAELLSQAANTIRLDPARQPGLTTTLGRLAAWRRDGASWEHDVLPVVTTIAAKRGPPIASWKFFDAAIAQSIADNRQALNIPEARHAAPSDVRRSDRHVAVLDNYDRHWSGAEQGSDLLAARRNL